MTIPEMAHWLVVHEFIVVPVAYKDKVPIGENWPQLRISLTEIDQYFNGQPRNVGVLLGEPYNLTDIDLDARESLWAWPEFAPEDPTTVFGRPSKPASHFLYFPDEPLTSIRYQDPITKGDACLLEARSRTTKGELGMQTVFPPSIHPSGERIEFAGGMMILPAKVERERLLRATRYTAAACLLGRYAPGERSGRHSYFLAIAGTLAHAGRPLNHARRLLRALYRILWGNQAELFKAEQEADSTFQRHDDGHEITGLPHLEDILDRRVLNAVTKWLGLERREKRPDVEILPPVRRMKEFLDLDIVMPRQRIDKLLIQPGVTLIVGPPKSGKTVLAVQMLMALARGLVPGHENERALFGYYSLEPGVTFILEQDDRQGDASLKDFYTKCRAGRDSRGYLDLPCHSVTGTDFVFGPRLYNFLRSTRNETGAIAMVLDSYSALRSGRPAHVDIVKSELEEFRQLADLSKELAMALAIVHHASKTSAHLDAFSRAAGSFAVGAGVDTMIVVDRFRDAIEVERERLVQVRGRKLEELDLVLRFQKDTLDYDWVMEGTLSTLYPEIRQLELRFPGRAFTVKEIASELGWSRPTAYRILNRLRFGTLIDKRGDAWSWKT